MASSSYLKNSPLKDKIPESWDAEVCLEQEADLYTQIKKCHKHPTHTGFIPVDRFDITHLPMDYQDNDIVEYIKLVAQLTVRLTVRYVSPKRPATVPGTGKPYPFYKKKGQNKTRLGTGMITDVEDDGITIKTAAHVVFDKDEAENAICDFFYDNGNRPAVCNTAIEVRLRSVFVSSNAFVDESFLQIFLQDKELYYKTKSFFSKMLELRTKIINRLSERSYDRQNNPLTFIVSHPHGCSKKISIGRCLEVDDNLDDFKVLYTTPTCPGSSGAAVICLDKMALSLNNSHNGTWKDFRDLNQGSCTYIPFDMRLQRRTGIHISEDCRLPDSECGVLCPLPHELNYNLMYDYINLWSYLCVNYVSEQRPEFWPGSKLPYPWYKKRGSRKQRKGRGWVNRVVIYPNKSSPGKTCDCDKCRNSSTPKTNFAHIYILTSTSLVFDHTEGSNTTCDVLYAMLDRLSGTQPVFSHIDTDRSQLVFVTHDLVLSEILNKVLKHISFLKEKIQDKFSPYLSANPVSIKIGKYINSTIGRCVRVDKHLVYTNKDAYDDVGTPIIVLGNKHLHVDVTGHTGQYPHDSKLGYSRYLEYRYK